MVVTLIAWRLRKLAREDEDRIAIWKSGRRMIGVGFQGLGTLIRMNIAIGVSGNAVRINNLTPWLVK